MTPAGRPGRDDDRADRGGQYHDPGQRDDHGDQRDDWGDQGARPPPAWPDVPPLVQPGPAAIGYLAPGGGLLDLRLPWATLTGQSSEPGTLGRLGPITPAQASYLAGPHQTDSLTPIHAQVLAAAQAAAARAASDAQAAGGCAHTQATPAYRPTRNLWEHVTARDLTCRFLTCRQPATRCDLDHTTPYDQDGRTCSCNLGGLWLYMQVRL